MAEDERAARLNNGEKIDALIEDQDAAHPLDEVLAKFCAVEAPIYDVSQIVKGPYYQVRGSAVSVPNEELGQEKMAVLFPKLSLTPGQLRFAESRPLVRRASRITPS